MSTLTREIEVASRWLADRARNEMFPRFVPGDSVEASVAEGVEEATAEQYRESLSKLRSTPAAENEGFTTVGRVVLEGAAASAFDVRMKPGRVEARPVGSEKWETIFDRSAKTGQ